MAPPTPSHWRTKSVTEKSRSTYAVRTFRRNPTPFFKLASAAVVIGFYLLYTSLHPYQPSPSSLRAGRTVQRQDWFGRNVTRSQDERADKVREVMRGVFREYRDKAWGYDAVKPASGGRDQSGSWWGEFMVGGSTTLAVMRLWEELGMVVEHVVGKVYFGQSEGLVDPFEATKWYLGALVSLHELKEAGVVPEHAVSAEEMGRVAVKAEQLAAKLACAYDSPTGMPWPMVDVNKDVGRAVPPGISTSSPSKFSYKNPACGLARAGSSILENYAMSDLGGNRSYHALSQRAWAPLVWNKYVESMPGLVDGPLDIITGAPLAQAKGWDASYGSYYEYLLKFAILNPHDRYTRKYEERWLEAASAIRHNLSSRSSPTDNQKAVHLFMGQVHEDGTFLNEMSHEACAAPGNLIYGGAYFNISSLITLGQALLETCHHLHNSTPTGLAPDSANWVSSTPRQVSHFKPKSARQESELAATGFFVADAQYNLRPEYVESLFYAWRVTGEERYREWAWDAFTAIEKHCKTSFGYAAVKDVMAGAGRVELVDETGTWFAAETLKYLYLTFSDVEMGNLEEWVYTTGGHPLKRR
ncbi:hypothetical protein LTS18_007842 [Coniosporium uncinatum]|uniref:Uncharacterized protein n=1 Tax=Coniosporium uncinatum TaxID=93489 RepID=A0ACC3DZY6_9PEZI|nr:hypothetical protein LTS18_007842 [Coniosporium uncinatum]